MRRESLREERGDGGQLGDVRGSGKREDVGGYWEGGGRAVLNSGGCRGERRWGEKWEAG